MADWHWLKSERLWLTLGGTTALALLLAWALVWQVDPLQVESPPPDLPPVASQHLDLIGSHQGQRRWRLQAQSAQFQGSRQIFDQGAQGVFYSYGEARADSPEPLLSSQELRWVAGYADYDAGQDLLTLREQVTVTSPDGDELVTAELRVQPGQQLQLPTAFRLSSQQLELAGEAGTFWVNDNRLEAQRGRLTWRDSQGDVVITADRIEYNRSTQVALGEGNLVIQQPGLRIQAPQGSYDRPRATSAVVGGVRLQERREIGSLLAQATTTRPSRPSESEEVTITADQLQYDRNTQIATGQGNLVIEQGATRLLAPQGTYKRRDSQSILVGGVRLEEPNRVLTAERMNGNHRDKIFLFEDNIRYRQEGEANPPEGATAELRRAATEVTAQQLLYNSATETAYFTGQVEFVQRGRKAKAKEAIVGPDRVILTGSVVLEQIQGDWLAQQAQDPEVQAALRQPTVIYAERVEIDPTTNDAQFWQDVVIVQANRAAEGDKATYSEATQIMTLEAENVPVLLCDRGDSQGIPGVTSLPGRDALDATCRGANRIRSRLITLDMDKNTFAAVGQSSMQFRLDDSSL
ncbi:MAG: LptA/OstA family protein [Thermostichales cyanobacterium BF4_bins_65]